MAFDEALARRIHEVLATRGDVVERRMFGGIAFMLGGHMCRGVVNNDLMVRVGDEQHDALHRAARMSDVETLPPGSPAKKPSGDRQPARLRPDRPCLLHERAQRLADSAVGARITRLVCHRIDEHRAGANGRAYQICPRRPGGELRRGVCVATRVVSRAADPLLRLWPGQRRRQPASTTIYRHLV